ncbi:FAD:protein FMN transferase [Arenimonas sp.]|uniref:FAD:protein FMN transferase n=1 Tax=Arenimonas sp. TaxID=1872635 RepID=UPI0039E4C085
MGLDAVAAFAVDTLGGASMGTTWSVRLLAPGRDLRRLHAVVESELARVVAQMSNWDPDSDISRFNRASAGSWHRLPNDFWNVLDRALSIAEASDGAFDPTVGPIVDAWGFGPPGRTADLERQQCGNLAARIGWRRMQRRPQDQSILQPGDLQLDLCAIAKGYAVDLVVACLRDEGVASALVEIGGELYGYGRRADGKPWRVLVDDDGDDEPCVVELDRRAIASSGDRWHHREDADGQRLSHSIDPRLGRPAADAPHLVSVLAEDAMQADAWATALMVMGARKGFDFACGKGLAARFVDREGRECATPSFAAVLAC